MEKHSGDIVIKFMKGEHVMRYQKRLWNGIWSDMIIETTHMKYEKSLSDMIGFKTKHRSRYIWTNNHHIINKTLHNFAKFTEQYEKVITSNEEES